MRFEQSKLGDIISALVQAGVFLLLALLAVGATALGAVRSGSKALTNRLPSVSEAAVVFPQFLILLFLLVVIPVTLIGSGLSKLGPRILSFLKGLEAVVGATAYLLAFIMVLSEIVMREIFSSTIGGTQEAAILGAVIAGFLGFSLVTSVGAHLRINFLDGLVPDHIEETFIRFTDGLAAIILVLLAYFAATFVQGTYEYADRVETLLIPLWPFQLVMIYAFGASALKHLIFFTNPALRPIPPAAAH